MADEKNELKILTSAGSAVEAAIVCGRLTDAGIPTMRGPGGRWGAAGRDVYVKKQDLDRAREVLKADEEGFSEEELARLSQEAGSAAIEDGSPSGWPRPTPPADDERREPDNAS